MGQFKPSRDLLLVKLPELTATTDSGLFIPETSQERPLEGQVMAAGPECSLKSGEIVLFTKYSGSQIHLENVPFLILKETDVLGVIE